MATNDFLVFGGGAGANVVTQAAWAALAGRTGGFASGVAHSDQMNKAWRQSSIMAAVLAQFISDRTGQDVLDDGTTATILANLKASAAAVNGDATKTFSVAAATQANHAVNQSQAFGLGQTTQNVTASRAAGTTYTNSTTKPIFVEISLQVPAGVGANFAKNVGNVQSLGNIGASPVAMSFVSMIYPGQTYSISVSAGVTINSWFETRT